MRTVHSPDRRFLECDCGRNVRIMDTCYGARAICGHCSIRWTYINGEKDWVAEKR